MMATTQPVSDQSAGQPAPAPASAPRIKRRLGVRLGIGILTVVIVLVAINLGLHFGQKRHDRLPYSIERAFPPDKPFVPGEIYATTMAEIMDHELNDGFGWRPNPRGRT